MARFTSDGVGLAIPSQLSCIFVWSVNTYQYIPATRPAREQAQETAENFMMYLYLEIE